MRILALVFVALILALQYPMWLGKGGWLSVRELDRQLDAQREANAALGTRNQALEADVGDLKTGYEAIEERARAELGMVRGDEVMFQLQAPGNRAAPPPLPGKALPPPKGGAANPAPASRRPAPAAGTAATPAAGAAAAVPPATPP